MKDNDIIMELREIKELLQLQQPVLTLRQFAKFAGISEEYAYKLTSSGRLKFYRPMGKKIFVDRDVAIEFLRQNPVSERKDVNRIASKYLLK
ncbi:MAG TPA: type IV toxin-antitoxin system AbiEi family antitoxin domain-containing protein [Flavobacterium sp.]|nr:type IV toxin-antitoxin system AbiEi family antitoxin domain-containing protein [Flavobacterium sp.]